MKHVVVCGAFGIGSAGDEAGLRVLVDILDDAKVTVLMRNPDPEYGRKYGVSVHPKLEHTTREEAGGRIFRGLNAGDNPRPIDELLRLLHTADLLILGPGDFINEDCPDVMRGALAEMAVMAWLAEWTGVPVMVYAASARRLTHTHAIAQARYLLTTAKVVTIRDRLSIGLLADAGLPIDAIRECPDPVLCMPRDDRVPQIAEQLTLPVLAVSVRWIGYRGEKINNQYRDLIRRVCARWEGSIITIPQFVSDDGYPDDRQEAREILPGAIHIETSGLYPWEVESYYRLADRALVTRLHAAVFCHRLGIPFASIAYEPKVNGFLNSIDHPVCFPTDDADVVWETLQEAQPSALVADVDAGVYREAIYEAMV
jgi:polysaccharide pyruvyl transferase WcaK-like protein